MGQILPLGSKHPHLGVHETLIQGQTLVIRNMGGCFPSHHHKLPNTFWGAMGTTNHLTLLQLFTSKTQIFFHGDPDGNKFPGWGFRALIEGLWPSLRVPNPDWGSLALIEGRGGVLTFKFTFKPTFTLTFTLILKLTYFQTDLLA